VADKNDVSSYLVRLLSSSPRPLKGSELSVLIKTQFPDFSLVHFGCRNLRDFIRKHAAEEIMEQGKAGMDIIYVARTPEQQPLFEKSQIAKSATFPPTQRGPLRQLLANPRIWKTFVTPTMPFNLFVNSSSGQIRVYRPEEAPGPPWIEIPRMSAEKLLQIARDFIDEMPEPQRAPLSRLLDDPKWWITYFEYIRSLGLTRRWIQHRRRRIVDEFEKSLPILPSPVADVSTSPLTVEHEIPEMNIAATEPGLKQVAVNVVQRMNDSELRSLNLPLGYVLDALKAR
jgi:hypothetical protein